MNKSLIRMTIQDTDPYFIREILLVLLSYIIVNSYFSLVGGFGYANINYLSAISFGVFLLSVMYAAVASGNFGRQLNKGSIGFLMTLPINRKWYLYNRIFFSVLLTVLFFSIPLLVLEFLASFSLQLSFSLMIIFSLAATISFYVSVGHIIAILSKSGEFATLFTLVIFLFPGLYYTRIFPHSYLGQFLIAGYGMLDGHLSLKSYTLTGSVILLLISIIITFVLYPILLRKNIRSGR